MSTARELGERIKVLVRSGDAWLFHGDKGEHSRDVALRLIDQLVSLAQPGEGALTGWTKPEEGLPELGVEVLVWSKEPWEKEPSMKLDTWNEQHEAPLSFSTQTIPIGPGWNNHDDFYSVIAWMPLPPPPGITSTPGDSNG